MNTELSQFDREQLSAYLDGALDATQSQQVEELLASCPEWADAYADWQAIDRGLESYYADDVVAATPAADLADRIVARAHRHPVLLRVSRWPVPAAAAAALVIGVLVMSPRETVSPTGDTLAQRDARKIDEFAQSGLGLFARMADQSDARPLSEKIREQIGDSLATSLTDNRNAWNLLTEPQRNAARREALAFLNMETGEQINALRYYRGVSFGSPYPQQDRTVSQAGWLEKITASLTDTERDAIQKMSLARKADFFLQRRAKLGQAGIPTNE